MRLKIVDIELFEIDSDKYVRAWCESLSEECFWVLRDRFADIDFSFVGESRKPTVDCVYVAGGLWRYQYLGFKSQTRVGLRRDGRQRGRQGGGTEHLHDQSLRSVTY